MPNEEPNQGFAFAASSGCDDSRIRPRELVIALCDEPIRALKRDNVRDHPAGMSDPPLQNTRKSGLVCITLLSGAQRTDKFSTVFKSANRYFYIGPVCFIRQDEPERACHLNTTFYWQIVTNANYRIVSK